METIKYLNFPLCFLQLLSKDKDFTAHNKICTWSIVNYSNAIKYDIYEVARQITYALYKRPGSLKRGITSKLNKLIKDESLLYDEDYKGFGGEYNTFQPDNEIQSLLSAFEEWPEFKADCIQQYQVNQAQRILDIDRVHIDRRIEVYNELNKHLKSFESVYGPDAWTSVNSSYLFDAMDGKLPVDLFRLVASVKSLIGSKRYFFHTYKEAILNRMFGAKSRQAMQELILDNDIRQQHEKLSRRRQWNKLLDHAASRKLIAVASYHRGYFVSIKYAGNPEKLIEAVNSKVNKPIRPQIKKKKCTPLYSESLLGNG